MKYIVTLVCRQVAANTHVPIEANTLDEAKQKAIQSLNTGAYDAPDGWTPYYIDRQSMLLNAVLPDTTDPKTAWQIAVQAGETELGFEDWQTDDGLRDVYNEYLHECAADNRVPWSYGFWLEKRRERGQGGAS